MLRKEIPIFILFMNLASCATQNIGIAPNGPQTQMVSATEYQTLIDSRLQKQKIYDGLVELMEFKTLLVSSDLAMAQVDQNERIYQYSNDQYLNEKGTVQSNLAKQTEIFISLFVPETKYDDLAKKTSRWKIFLDVAGQRYEGRAVRLKNQLTEIQSIYPFHNRWSTAYRLIFQLPTSIAEGSPAKLTLTGPTAAAAVEFPAIKN